MLCFVFCTAHIAANYKFDALFCILRCTHCSTLLKADSEQKAMHTTYCSTQNLHFSSTNTTIRMLSAPSKMICNAQWSIARWYIVHFALQWSLGLPWGDGAAKGTEFRFQRQPPPHIPPIPLPTQPSSPPANARTTSLLIHYAVCTLYDSLCSGFNLASLQTVNEGSQRNFVMKPKLSKLAQMTKVAQTIPEKPW